MKAEWESSKLAHEATRAEFESYKVRYTVRRKSEVQCMTNLFRTTRQTHAVISKLLRQFDVITSCFVA